MQDFLLRFAECGDPTNADTCRFKTGIEGLIVGLLSIGTLFGALGGGELGLWRFFVLIASTCKIADLIVPTTMTALVADWLGRRNAMSIECCIFTVGVVIQLASVSAWYQFAIGRFIAGLGVGALSAAVPLYQAETGKPYRCTIFTVSIAEVSF